MNRTGKVWSICVMFRDAYGCKQDRTPIVSFYRATKCRTYGKVSPTTLGRIADAVGWRDDQADCQFQISASGWTWTHDERWREVREMECER